MSLTQYFTPHPQDAKEEDDEEAVAAAVERADREDHKRDVHPFDGEGLLGAEEASKLLGERGGVCRGDGVVRV